MEHTVTKHKLEGGAELLVVNMKQAVSFYLGCFIRGGSRYAPDNQRELSHLLEHLMFEGNRQISDPLKFRQEVEKYGALCNASTGLDLVRYFYVGGRDDLHRLVNLAANQVYFPTFTAENVKEQQDVITRELARRTENDSSILGLSTHALLNGETWAADIALRTKQMKTISHKDLMHFHANHYTAGNSRWVVVGAISPADQQKLIDHLNATLQEAPQGPLLDLISPELLPGYANTVQAHAATRPAQTIFDIKYLIPGEQLADRATRSVLVDILSGGLGSRLWTKTRKAGLTYGISAYTSTGRKYTSFGISSQTTNTDVPALLDLTFGELEEVVAGKFTQEELDRATRYKIGSMQRRYQVPVEYANWYAADFALDESLISPEGWIEELRAVTLADVKRVAKKYVQRKHGFLSYIGNNVDDSSFRVQLDRIK